VHDCLAVDAASSLTCIYHNILRDSDDLVEAAERRDSAGEFWPFCGGEDGVTMSELYTGSAFSELPRRVTKYPHQAPTLFGTHTYAYILYTRTSPNPPLSLSRREASLWAGSFISSYRPCSSQPCACSRWYCPRSPPSCYLTIPSP
jgi:hypothetical protein